MVKLTQELGERIALAYDRMPVSPSVDLRTDYKLPTIVAYNAFARETADQYRQLGKLVTPIWDDCDPYKNSAEMFRDIDKSGTFRVFAGSLDHPILYSRENWMFRAVHDYYGHYVNRNSFSASGELKATRQHAKMYSALALPAMITETLGQNAWVNFHPDHRHLHPAKRPYAIQKAALLPTELWKDLIQCVI